jgi:hypothetical protein
VVRRAVIGALCAMFVLVGGSVAGAQTSTGYTSWSVDGSGAAWTGALDVAPVAGGPSGSFVTNSLSPTVPSGASIFLGATTPFGAVFGSSQSQPYLQTRYTTGTQTATTVITFDVPTPTQRGGLGWGFALGDIDADAVTLSATTVGGASVTAAELGWQGGFNFCDTSPRPSGCTGGVYTDVPVWDAGTATLTGNGADSSGAAGWFRPTVPLTSLTLVFTPLSGLPVFDLWVAAAGGTSLAGAVRCEGSGGVTEPLEGVEVSILDAAGEAVTVGGEPLIATTDAAGGYAFDGLTPGSYTLSASSDGETRTESADTSVSDPSAVDLVFPCDEPPPPSTTSTSVAPTTTTTPTPPPTTAPPSPPTTASAGDAGAGGSTLPVTGLAGLGLVVVGAASVASGAALTLGARRRTG